MTPQPEQSGERGIELAARIERIAEGWRKDAQIYRGRRREWRLARADSLVAHAWDLIGLAP